MKIQFHVFFAALLVSCFGGPERIVLPPAETKGTAEAPAPYIITDYKNKSGGETMPKWVSFYYSGGAAGIETLDTYRGRYVFVSRNGGNNFNALSQWTTGFDANLDFPRLAAARIEERFLSGVSSPDREYGAFYEALVRASSDALWTGAVREDDFWIRREFIPGEGEEEFPAGTEGRAFPGETEDWEFLILVSIEKNLFASGLAEVFRGVKPGSPLSKDESAAVNRVKERFFEGF